MPVSWDEFRDTPVCGVGQSGEHIPEIIERIDAPASAAFDDGIEDGAARSRGGVAEDKPPR